MTDTHKIRLNADMYILYPLKLNRAKLTWQGGLNGLFVHVSVDSCNNMKLTDSESQWQAYVTSLCRTLYWIVSHPLDYTRHLQWRLIGVVWGLVWWCQIQIHHLRSTSTVITNYLAYDGFARLHILYLSCIHSFFLRILR